MDFIRFLIVVGTLSTLGLTACFEEEFTMDPAAQLEFSLDTLRFDTVFTELGSATRSFRVFNRNDLPLKINFTSVEEQSFFRFNIDGFQGPEVSDVEVLDGDSVWVFVEVTIDPDMNVSASPFVIEEFITFETNGNTQQVMLEAWGQNANYIPERSAGNAISLLSCDLETITWDDSKPYVIYGTLLIDSCTLVWPAGTEIYVHGGLADNVLGVFNDGIIFTLPDGKIRSEGTLEEPVIVTDDRIEEDYQSTWGGLRFGPASGPHVFSHTDISNAITGVTVDSAAVFVIDNSKVHNTNGTGLFARNARVRAVNTLFHNNAGAGLALTFGGDYDFDYCTVGNYGNDGDALVITNFFCPEPNCMTGALVTDIDARMRNCIFVGSSRDEILLIDAAVDLPTISFDVSLEQCVVQVEDLLEPENFPDFFEDVCNACVTYTFGDTLFSDLEMQDYHLDTMSIAIAKATTIAGISTDLDGVLRDVTNPDIGCYEFKE